MNYRKPYRELTNYEIVYLYNNVFNFLAYDPGERFYIVMRYEDILSGKNMMNKEKTIKDAIKKLSTKERESFLELWKETDCIDLYDGNLDAYILTILTELRRKDEQIEDLKNRLETIKITIEK